MRFLIRCAVGVFMAVAFTASVTAQWRDVSPEGLLHHLRSVSFVDEMTGYAAGWIEFSDQTIQGVIARTTDGGESWTFQGIDDREINAMAFIDANNGFLVGRSPDCDCPVVYRTSDGGTTWSWSEFTDMVGGFRGIDFYDETHGVIGGGDPQTASGYALSVNVTPEGDEYQTIFEQELAHVSRVVMPSQDIVFMAAGDFAGTENTVYKLTGVGTGTLEDVESENLHSFDGLVLLSGLDFVDEETGYAGLTVIEGSNFGGAVYKTDDGGETWDRVYSSITHSLVGMDFLDEGRGIASGSGAIIMTNDGGETWTETVPVVDELGVWIEYVTPGTAFVAGTNGTILKYTQTSSIGGSREVASGSLGGVSVSPLPATSHVRIGLMNPQEGMDYTLRVFDILGNEIHHDVLGTVDVVVEVSGMPSGIYFYRIFDENRPVASGRFMVQ